MKVEQNLILDNKSLSGLSGLSHEIQNRYKKKVYENHGLKLEGEKG